MVHSFAASSHIGQVVVPDGIVQAERLVALAPAVARPVVLFEDDRRHAELAQPRAERDAALPAADDDGVGLLLVAERALLVLALLLPGLRAEVLPVLGAERAGEAGFLLMALELGKGRQQGPDQAVLEAHQAITAPGRRLERDPAFQHAVRLRRRLAAGNAPAGRLGRGKLCLQHVAHLIAALDGLDVPGEGDEVAPIAILGKEIDRIVDAATFEGSAKGIEKRLDARGGGLVEHGISSCYLPAKKQQAACQIALTLFYQSVMETCAAPFRQMQQMWCNRCCRCCVS